jgi:Carboxypeptidase regulatory-like domain
MARARFRVLVGLALFAPSGLVAQQSGAPESTGVLSMLVTSRDDGQALPYGTIAIQSLAIRRFTDATGRLTLRGLPPGSYTIEAREIGFAPRDTIVTVHAGAPMEVTIPLGRVAIRLARINVHAHRSRDCTVPGIPAAGADSDVNAIFSELRSNIDRVRLLSEEYPLSYSLERLRVRRRAGAPDVVIEHDTVVFDDRREAYKPGNVVYFDVDHGVRTQMARLVTFSDLADSVFQANHCFEYAGEPKVGKEPMIKIDFRAARWVHTPDVEGSIYLDANRYVVRRAVVHLSHGERADPPVGDFGITTTFREVAPLLTLFETVDADERLGDAGRAFEHDKLLSYRYVERSPGQ